MYWALAIIMVITVFSQYEIIGDFSQQVFQKFFTSQAGNFSMLRVLMVIFIIVGLFSLLDKLEAQSPELQLLKRKCFHGHLAGTDCIRYIKHKGLFIFHPHIDLWGLYLYSTYMDFSL